MGLFAPLCNKLRFLSKAPSFKCIFSLNLTPVISLAVIYRSIIADRVTRSPVIVKINIALQDFCELLSASAFFDFKIHK